MKERKEIFYADLNAIVIGETETAFSGEKWLEVPYETAEYKGTALVASETAHPNPVSLKLNVKGWHKIYLCLADVTGANCLEVSLTKEKGKTFVRPSHLAWVDGTFSWSSFDFAEEVFYKAADLTGQDLIINKPVYGVQFTAALFAIRLVPMTATEIEEYTNSKNTSRMAYHFDTDYFSECDYNSPDDYLGRIDMLHAGNADLLIHECSICDDIWGKDYPRAFFEAVKHKKLKAKGWSQEIFKRIKERAHSYGMKILVGCRVEAGRFLWPSTSILNHEKSFCGDEYRLQTREGRFLGAGSFAYKQVRQVVINEIIKELPMDWDGVSIFLHRGILVGFEEPIRKYVEEKYGVDARQLPYGDARLADALSIPMTEFFKELRNELDIHAKKNGVGRYAINVVSLFNYDNCKEFGYDFEAWAKDGLIDSICQGLMGYKEEVSDLLADDGMIDLQKYKEAQKSRHVFTRYYDAKKDVILPALPKWLEISKKYDVDFYATMPWEHPPYNEQIAMAKALYEAGAEKLFSWNTNHSATRPATIQAIKNCGDKERVLNGELKEYRKIIRIYSFGGNDVSMFCVNWMG